jgi:hypothetical protein
MKAWLDRVCIRAVQNGMGARQRTAVKRPRSVTPTVPPHIAATDSAGVSQRKLLRPTCLARAFVQHALVFASARPPPLTFGLTCLPRSSSVARDQLTWKAENGWAAPAVFCVSFLAAIKCGGRTAREVIPTRHGRTSFHARVSGVLVRALTLTARVDSSTRRGQLSGCKQSTASGRRAKLRWTVPERRVEQE